MECFCRFCFRQEVRPSLTEEDIERGCKKEELNELRRSYIQEKGFTVFKMECERWRRYKTSKNVRIYIRGNFPIRHSFAVEHLLQEKEN